MLETDGRAEAADAVCRSIAQRRDETGWTMVSTEGFEGFPPEVQAWQSKIGPHVAYPACVLASYASGRPFPAPDDPDE